ncbi:hypothetical protein FRB93_006705 [Tulasnella sp. JGI-2019a]|nr:hypothetical protein FRB93_006705 [Tulasnella sp. JGI-2019a]
MSDPATVEPQNAAEDSKQKGILGLIRRATSTKPTPPPEAVAATKGEPSSVLSGENVATEPADITVAEPVAPATASGLTGAQIEAKWDQVITEAMNKPPTVMQKLKRLTSKDGKSRKNTKETPTNLEADEPLMTDIVETEEGGGGTDTPPMDPKLKAALSATPGANTLSRRIQVMLSNVPPFLHTVPDGTTPDAPSTSKPTPAPAPPLTDAKLLGYLSDPSVMNGDAKVQVTKAGKTKKSVWQVLDQLVPYKPPVADVTDEVESTAADAAGSSLMITGPLIPNDKSVVHIAQSQIVEVEAIEQIPGIPKSVAKGVFLSIFPPFWKKKKTIPSPPSPDLDSAPALPATTQVKVWIPSKTELSFQVAWWGFRLWLPPPVMVILSDKTIEATKRAAMVTAAIGWLINNIPMAMLPLPLQPAITLLKAVVPYLGYIGGFISWSWAEVKSFDKGNGVVLSATWLLPIALIPGTWETVQGDVPVGSGTTPAPGTTIPAPGTTTPTPGASTSGTAAPS